MDAFYSLLTGKVFPNTPRLYGDGFLGLIAGRLIKFFEKEDEGIIKTLQDAAQEMERCGVERCAFWLGNKPVLILADPDDIENFKKNYESHLDTDIPMLTKFLGKTFLNIPEEEVAAERKILMHSIRQNLSFEGMNKLSNKHLNFYSSQKQIDFKRFFTGYTLDIFTHLFIGFQNSDLHKINTLVDLLDDLTTQVFQFRSVFKWVLPYFLRNHFFPGEENNLEKIRENIKSRFTAFYSPNNDHPQYLRELSEYVKELNSTKSKNINFDDVFGRLLFITTAASATTAATLQFTTLMIHNTPEVLIKLREEFSQHKITVDRLDPASINPLTLEEIKALPYLDAIITEVLRLFPPTAFYLPRESKKEFSLGALKVPKKSIVMATPYIWQNSEKYYAEPEKFHPERFLQNGSETHTPRFPEAFSLGARTCPGRKLALAEMKIMLLNLYLKYDIQLENAHFENAHKIALTFKTGAITPKAPLIGTLKPRITK